MVELRNVSSGYGQEEILHHINLSFEEGKITVIVGPNGCGKSTLLKTIVGLNSLTSGEIIVEGKKKKEFESTSLAQQIAYLPQNKIPVDISVLRMVLHGRFPYLKYPRRYQEKDNVIAQNALEQMEIGHLANKNINQLSGGIQQKVYIAMALAQNTSTILMDEPTVYLDISYQMRLMDMARELVNNGKAVVMILHDLTQAFRIADKIVVMEQGKVVMCDIPEKVYESGIVEKVFGIRMERVQTKTGLQYFYDKVISKTEESSGE